jgi:hypothetical protein
MVSKDKFDGRLQTPERANSDRIIAFAFYIIDY